MKLDSFLNLIFFAAVAFFEPAVASPFSTSTPTRRIFARATCTAAPRPPALSWPNAVTKGRTLYHALQAKVVANPPPPDNDAARAIYDSEEYEKEFLSIAMTPRALTVPFLNFMGVIVDNNYRVCTVNNWDQETNDSHEEYNNWFRTAPGPSGVIMARNNYRNGGPLHWSDATYYQWSDANAYKPKWHLGLRYIVRHEIENVDTVSIIMGAYASIRQNSALNWRWLPSDEPFYALIGTPNGQGVLHMLTDHFLGLGKLNVASIESQCPCTAQTGGMTICFMGFTLAPSTPPAA
ncbi:hypothetical protein MMC06_005969 [Schaereria dolodes]|nr:hypothetical protein [Schaereria dolodes]